MNKKFFVSCLISLLVLLLAYLQPYKVVVVLGNSMHPTLKHGQIVLAKKVTKFEKGDIVVFRNDFEEIVIKRILFMPDSSQFNCDAEVKVGPFTYKSKVPGQVKIDYNNKTDKITIKIT